MGPVQLLVDLSRLDAADAGDLWDARVMLVPASRSSEVVTA